MYEAFIQDGIDRGLLDPINIGAIELPIINRNNNTPVNEQATVPNTITSSHINITQ